jgi:hypothetical protein
MQALPVFASHYLGDPFRTVRIKPNLAKHRVSLVLSTLRRTARSLNLKLTPKSINLLARVTQRGLDLIRTFPRRPLARCRPRRTTILARASRWSF